MVCRERVFSVAMTCFSGDRKALVAKAAKADGVGIVPGFCQEQNIKSVFALDFEYVSHFTMKGTNVK